MSLLYGSLESAEGDCFGHVWSVKSMSVCMRQRLCDKSVLLVVGVTSISGSMSM